MMRDWVCPECRKVIGTTKAWGHGMAPLRFKCAEHPTAGRVSELPREPKNCQR